MSPIPMPVALGADLIVSYPLIAQLFTRHGCTQLDADNLDAFVAQPGTVLLVFLEDPMRFKEALDMAVVVPQLQAAFAGRFAVGVLLPKAARQFQVRYGFNRWPALVLLKGGQYLGAIDGLRNWDEYTERIAQLLLANPTRPPSVGIAVRAPAGPGGGCAA